MRDILDKTTIFFMIEAAEVKRYQLYVQLLKVNVFCLVSLFIRFVDSS